MDKNDKEQLLKNTCLLISLLCVLWGGHWCEGSEDWVQSVRRRKIFGRYKAWIL